MQRVVAIAAFTTLREEAATVVGGRLSRLLIENYDNRENLAEISKRNPGTRVAIFHGTNDEVIPARMGRELWDEFPVFVKFHPVAGADHVSVLHSAASEILGAMNE